MEFLPDVSFISTTDYERKIETLLDPITYKKLSRDPTARILRTND